MIKGSGSVDECNKLFLMCYKVVEMDIRHWNEYHTLYHVKWNAFSLGIREM